MAAYAFRGELDRLAGEGLEFEIVRKPLGADQIVLLVRNALGRDET